MIPSPRTRLYQSLIPLEIGDVATVGAAWSYFGIEATWAAGELTVTATAGLEAAGLAAALGSATVAVAGGLALIGGVGVATALIAAPFIGGEGILHDITDIVTEVHSYLSPMTQLLIGLTAPFTEATTLKDYTDPFVLQKLGGSIADLITGGVEVSQVGLMDIVGSTSGVQGWLNDAEDVYNYLTQPPPPLNRTSPSGAGTAPNAPGSVGGYSSGGGMYPFSPGLGDASYFSGSEADDSSGMSFNGGGFTTTINVGGTDPDMPGPPTSTVDPPTSDPGPTPAPEPVPQPDPGSGSDPDPDSGSPPTYAPPPDESDGF